MDDEGICVSIAIQRGERVARITLIFEVRPARGPARPESRRGAAVPDDARRTIGPVRSSDSIRVGSRERATFPRPPPPRFFRRDPPASVRWPARVDPPRRVARPSPTRAARFPLPRAAQDAYPKGEGDGGARGRRPTPPPPPPSPPDNAAAEVRPSRAPLHLVDALALVGDAFGCASDIEAAVAASAFETHDARGETRGPAGRRRRPCEK